MKFVIDYIFKLYKIYLIINIKFDKYLINNIKLLNNFHNDKN